jgi:chorismate mutase
MQLNKRKLAMLIALTITATSAARGQSADRLLPLVETSARRLLIAERVELAKWDSGAAVEDLPREVQVIKGAVRDGDSRDWTRHRYRTFSQPKSRLIRSFSIRC